MVDRTGFEPVSLDPESKEPISSQPKIGGNARFGLNITSLGERAKTVIVVS